MSLVVASLLLPNAATATRPVPVAPNLTLTSVPGIRVGHHTLTERPTGCTVVLIDRVAVVGVAQRGAAPGTRDTASLDPLSTSDRVAAIAVAAVLIVLWVGGKPHVRPDADCGDKAAAAATAGPVREGTVGAGYARTIVPIHTIADGDTIFSVATGQWRQSADVTLIGSLAADVMARAVVRAVTEATSVAGIPAARDLRR